MRLFRIRRFKMLGCAFINILFSYIFSIQGTAINNLKVEKPNVSIMPTESKYIFPMLTSNVTDICSSVTKFKNCLDEKILTSINGELVTFLWSVYMGSTPTGGYISKPPCLNGKLQLIERYCCDNGEWATVPTCESFQKEIPECPPGYNKTTDQLEETSFCYQVTNPSTWPPKCPFADEWSSFIYLYFNLNVTLSPNIKYVWFPAVRNVSYGLGSIQSVGFTKDNIAEHIKVTNETLFSEHHCIAVQNDQGLSLKLVNCNEELPGLCFFYKPDILYNNQTNEVVYHNRHFPEKVGFYKVFSDNDTGRNAFCDRLAEPKNENMLMTLKNIFQSDSCWIGLEKNPLGLFIWSQSKTLIEYTNWDKTTNFTNDFGVLNSSPFNKNWTLHSNYEVNCAFCEIPLQYKTITLDLIDNGANTLILRQYNKFKFLDDVMCYTNAEDLITSLVPTFVEAGTGFVNYEVNISHYAGEYWCKSFDPLTNNIVHSNTVLVFGRNVKLEYVLHALVSFNFDSEPTLKINVYSSHLETLLLHQNQINITSVRVMAIENVNQKRKEMTLNFHLSSNGSNFNDEFVEFSFLEAFLAALKPDELFVSYGQLLRSNICFKTSFWTDPDLLINWDTTFLGESAVPDRLCLVDEQLAVRFCEGDFIRGASWSLFDTPCDSTAFSNSSNITQDLYEILISTETTPIIIESVLNLTKNASVINDIDISLLTRILEKIMNDGFNLNLTGSLAIVSNLMDSNGSSLSAAQKRNATDNLLEIIDNMAQLKNESNLVEVKTSNIISEIINLSLENITGVALRYQEGCKNFTNFDILHLTSNFTEQDLLTQENVDVAVCIPKELLDYLLRESNDTLYLIISAFYKDSLFNNENAALVVGGRTLSVTIPGFRELPTPLLIWFRNFKTNSASKCAFWHYGLNETGNPLKGAWKDEQPAVLKGPNLFACHFKHLTHFGLLVNDDFLGETQVTVLTVLTATGIAISCLGILGIVVTTFVYKTWKTDKNHQILLQICLVTVLQYVLFYAAVSDLVTSASTACVFIAAALHYVVLSQFCWMLVIAVLQYRRYVVVFGAIPSHILLKTSAVGWLLPAIPTIIVISVHTEYELGYKICYPKGLTLWLGTLMPIIVIIFSNAVLFGRIIYNLPNKRKLMGPDGNTKLIVAIVRLTISLFFILGLSWIFGLLAAFGGGIVFLYLFCVTSTIQGFVLFLYFIVLNEKTNPLWYKFICIIKCNAKYRYITYKNSISGNSDKSNVS